MVGACPFCYSRKVIVQSKTLRGSRAITSHQCEACKKVWSEETHHQIPYQSPPPPKRDTGTA